MTHHSGNWEGINPAKKSGLLQPFEAGEALQAKASFFSNLVFYGPTKKARLVSACAWIVPGTEQHHDYD
jgi:hypothetical protein